MYRNQQLHQPTQGAQPYQQQLQVPQDQIHAQFAQGQLPSSQQYMQQMPGQQPNNIQASGQQAGQSFQPAFQQAAGIGQQPAQAYGQNQPETPQWQPGQSFQSEQSSQLPQQQPLQPQALRQQIQQSPLTQGGAHQAQFQPMRTSQLQQLPGAQVGQQFEGVSQQFGQNPSQLPTQQQSEFAAQASQQQAMSVPPGSTTSPFVDMYDSPEEIMILADLPGYSAENVRVEANKRTLHIIAERDEEEAEEDQRGIQKERTQRSERTIQLPVEVDVDEADASCEDGVCRITLPKSEAERQKQIGIQ